METKLENVRARITKDKKAKFQKAVKLRNTTESKVIENAIDRLINSVKREFGDILGNTIVNENI